MGIGEGIEAVSLEESGFSRDVVGNHARVYAPMFIPALARALSFVSKSMLLSERPPHGRASS